MRDLILVGIPRSGSTLLTKLVGAQENWLSSDEPPIDGITRGNIGDNTFCRSLENFFLDTRKQIKKNGILKSHHIDGHQTDNHATDTTNGLGLRTSASKIGDIKIDQHDNADYSLLIKHNGPFAAILSEISNSYECYSIVRKPMDVLKSWNSVDFPVQDGRLPAGERISKELSSLLLEEKDRLERQIILINWFFKQIYMNISPARIIRYEDLINNPSKVLSETFKIDSKDTIEIKDKKYAYKPTEAELIFLNNNLDRVNTYGLY